MKLKIHSSELNRMMKTLGKCIDPRHQAFGNIEVIYDNNLLTLRGTNGMFSAVMSAPVMGGDGETFCIDGEMFGKICALSKGEVEIVTAGNNCMIRGAGKARLPIVQANIPPFARVEKGVSTVIKADDFARGFGGVEHAISTDEGSSRIQLTGVYTEIGEYGMKMVTLDGFRLAVETLQCSGEQAKMVVPGAFMRLIKDSTFGNEDIKLKTDGSRLQVTTEGMMISCPLLVGDFPDYAKMLPKEFKTECLVNAEQLRTALKNSSVVCSDKLVKFEISGNLLVVSGNSERADYETEVNCEIQGTGITIAFNLKYIMDTIASMGVEEVVLKMNTASSPCVVTGKQDGGLRLVLPVRVMG